MRFSRSFRRHDVAIEQALEILSNGFGVAVAALEGGASPGQFGVAKSSGTVADARPDEPDGEKDGETEDENGRLPKTTCRIARRGGELVTGSPNWVE